MMLGQQRAALDRGKLTAVEAVSGSLHAAEEWQGKINAFVAIDSEKALAATRAADAVRASGRATGELSGIPLAHKDMFDRPGHRCRFGSRLIQPEPQIPATVVQRVEAAGSITIGALNMAEFALGPTGHNAVFGSCRNPWDTTRITGGSSSGPAAAVAAGIIGGAIGSDTGGSIRIPAACCGVVGLKPTQGRVSVAGAMPMAPSLDCVGPLAASAVDCELLFRIIAGPDPRDPASLLQPSLEAGEALPLASLHLAFPIEAIARDTDAEVVDALETAVRELASRGVSVQSTRLPNVSHLHDLAEVIQQSEVSAAHLHSLAEHRDSYTPHIRRRIEAGLFVAATAYLSAVNQRHAHRITFIADMLGDAHAVVLPVLGMPVPRLDETDEVLAGSSLAIVERMTRWTRWLSYLGVPALSIPCGIDRHGMPIGLQLVGRPFSEITLLQIARRFQEITDWHARRPRAPGV
jgi:aspartyl-tRNA(Asn)/glutamyl-tRNA(Gln) amidotransferase subunit A